MVKSKSKSQSNSPNTISNFFKMGFGLGLGFMVVEIIFAFVAIVFFISGFILLKKEQAKEKKGEEVNGGLKILAYILMIIGALFALFLIIPIISELGGEFGDM